MIYIGITDARGASPVAYIELDLPRGVTEKIKRTANEDERRLRTAAYKTLSELYKIAIGGKMPDIIAERGEKPAFVANGNEAPKFNISHDRGFAVAAISKDIEIGVDIQSMPTRKLNFKKITERLFKGMKTKPLDYDEDDFPEVKIFFFEAFDGDFKRVSREGALTPISTADAYCDPLAKWTVLEASLKLDGGGFALKKRTEGLDPKTKTYSISLGNDSYFLTLAIP